MPYLAKWYANEIKVSPSKKKPKVPKKKLVIILKDFEGFHQKILHNLILILRWGPEKEKKKEWDWGSLFSPLLLFHECSESLLIGLLAYLLTALWLLSYL